MQQMRDQSQTPLEDSTLCTTVYNGLKKAGLDTLGEVTAYTAEELCARVREVSVGYALGPVRLANLRGALGDRGLYLKDEEPE